MKTRKNKITVVITGEFNVQEDYEIENVENSLREAIEILDQYGTVDITGTYDIDVSIKKIGPLSEFFEY